MVLKGNSSVPSTSGTTFLDLHSQPLRPCSQGVLELCVHKPAPPLGNEAPGQCGASPPTPSSPQHVHTHLPAYKALPRVQSHDLI